MTREEKLKVLAELDGVYFGNTSYDSEETWRTFEGEPCALKPYLTNYDAIIPLIQKQSRATLVRIVLSFKGQNDVSRMVDWLQFSPEQLADALIKAVGKWDEDPNDTTTIIGGKKYQ